VPRKVLVLQEGAAFSLTEVPAENEHVLQEIMKNNPILLPLDDLGLTGPMLVIGRETTVASGSIDLVGVVPSGDVVLVEFKTGPQNPDFRHALAQLIDYGSDLWGMSVQDFDTGVVQRYLVSAYCPPELAAFKDLGSLAQHAWGGVDFDSDGFVTRLDKVLTDGDFVYVVAAQRYTPQMTRSLEYLNTVTQAGRYHLVQLIQLDGQAMKAYVAQAVMTSRPSRQRSVKTRVKEGEFLAAIDDADYRAVLEDVFDRCRALGLAFEWGPAGTSIRLATPDRAEPLSIAWVFSGTPGWSGLTHLTLGYDEKSANATPSIAAALAVYVEAAQNIPGANVVGAKGLRAWMFQPPAAKAAKGQIIEVLEHLVASAGGQEPAT
jgi:hypothetical protein